MYSEVHVEVVQRPESNASRKEIATVAESFIRNRASPGSLLDAEVLEGDPFLRRNVSSIRLDELFKTIDASTATLRIHVYRLDFCGPGGDVQEYNEDEEELPSATHWRLPAKEFYGLWESLIYDSRVKIDTLSFAESALLFSDRGVDPNIVCLNRVILFHGPPGTGKTSLCKALAQKLAIRLNERYHSTRLIEINSHSLFSKWFSESGKLVTKLFNEIVEIAEDGNILVCLLIDEIESLVHARDASRSGTEPSDAIRVVNAVLTQLDRIRHYNNIIVLTTSNMTGAIDLAFADRADIKQYVGPPSVGAIYKIYHSCLLELMKANIITPKEVIFEYGILEVCKFNRNESTMISLELLKLAEFSRGLSGRALRKIPFLTHALHIDTSSTTLEAYLKAMNTTIAKQLADSESFSNNLERVNIK